MINKDDLVILVGHGQLPRDMPQHLQTEYLTLLYKHRRTTLEEERFSELDKIVMGWPRDEENDPYQSNLKKLASMLEQTLGCKVVAAFNEFCPPLFRDVLEDACSSEYGRIIVLTTMLLPGGIHSEVDIPETIREKSTKHGKKIIYMWPIDLKYLVDLYLKILQQPKP